MGRADVAVTPVESLHTIHPAFQPPVTSVRNARIARPARALLALLAVGLCACPAETTFVEPGTHSTGTSDTTGGKKPGDTTGVVQHAQLIVTVAVHGSDSALAARLGGAPGVLPKALV